jgi:hypothetical protein
VAVCGQYAGPTYARYTAAATKRLRAVAVCRCRYPVYRALPYSMAYSFIVCTCKEYYVLAWHEACSAPQATLQLWLNVSWCTHRYMCLCGGVAINQSSSNQSINQSINQSLCGGGDLGGQCVSNSQIHNLINPNNHFERYRPLQAVNSAQHLLLCLNFQFNLSAPRARLRAR